MVHLVLGFMLEHRDPRPSTGATRNAGLIGRGRQLESLGQQGDLPSNTHQTSYLLPTDPLHCGCDKYAWQRR
jgi:hypothetical protein